MTVCLTHAFALDLHPLTLILCLLSIHRQQRELEVTRTAPPQLHTSSNTISKAAVVPPDTSAAHIASALETSARQNAAAANAAHMVSRGASFPARTYPTADPQSSSAAQKKAFAESHGATSSSSAVKLAPTTPVPHATVHRQLDASGIASDSNSTQGAADKETAQRLATTTGTGVAAPHVGTTMLSTPANASVHSVAQPIVVAQGQHLHQHQHQLQAQQHQTAANTVDLTLHQSPHKTSVTRATQLVTPASYYGGQQSWTQSVTSSSSTGSTGTAQFTGARRNAMVCSDEVVASVTSSKGETQYAAHVH
jgi:hypothetical protein